MDLDSLVAYTSSSQHPIHLVSKCLFFHPVPPSLLFPSVYMICHLLDPIPFFFTPYSHTHSTTSYSRPSLPIPTSTIVSYPTLSYPTVPILSHPHSPTIPTSSLHSLSVTLDLPHSSLPCPSPLHFTSTSSSTIQVLLFTSSQLLLLLPKRITSRQVEGIPPWRLLT